MVDETLFKRYRDALGTVADLTKQMVETLTERYSGDLTSSELGQVYAAILARMEPAAAQVAMEFYKAQRAFNQVESAYEPTIPENVATDSALLAWDTKNNTKQQLSGAAMQRVMEAADRTIQYNLGQDEAGGIGRWALIPNARACAWCRLLGSQGFVYKQAYAQGQGARHPNCTCTMVVDFDADNPSLEGYDETALKDEYKAARKEIEDKAKVEWALMNSDERSAYTKATPKRRGAYDRYLRNRIVSQMRNNAQNS